MTQQLSISNVINVSVTQTPSGLSAFNTSNLAIFTTETPDPVFTDGYKIYLEATEVGEDFGTNSTTYAMALAVFGQNPNILLGGGYLVIIPFESSETLAAAITRTNDVVQYFGCMSTQVESGADIQAAAAVVQALTKMLFVVSNVEASINPGGDLDDITTAGYTHTRGLFYDDADDDVALGFQAAYASRLLSVVFSGSNTTSTMHLKQLAGVEPDPGIDQTLLDKAVTAGADTYPSIRGYPCVFCSGENSFVDQIYNLLWLQSALETAGFNYLAGSSTKIPQTENGMDGLKGAYRAVMQQAVANGYLAPGVWNSPTTFGNQVDFYQNVAQLGYYIYSAPIALQSQADRVAREAPLVQIAAKEAGAIQSSTVVVYVNQ